MKEIKNIAILKPIYIYSEIEDEYYIMNKGCMIVEYIDDTRSMLDLESMKDVTHDRFYNYCVTKKTKIKYIFKGGAK